MKKSLTIALSSLLILSGCDTYAGSSAYLGSNIGAILGSAIGGINDGPRGSDVGTIIGMAGGAVVGAIIGNSADQRAHDEMVEHREAVKQRRMEQQQNEMPESNYSSNDTDNYTSGFDATNSGDDRIYDFSSSDYTGNYSAQTPKEQMPQNSSVEDMAQSFTYTPSIEIRNARFVDDNEDGKIQRDEICKIIFEVINRGNQPLTDVVPTVIETNGNRHIFISPSMHIESIAPGKGIRYTALVKADNRLKPGNVKVCLSVLQGDKAISKVVEFNIPARK